MTGNWNYILHLFILFFTLSCGQGKKTGFQGTNADMFNTDPGPQSTGGGGGLPSLPGMGPTEQQALTNVGQEITENMPQSGPPDFSKAVDDAFKMIEEAEKKGQDTTQMRYALMGKMLSECANSAAQYAPMPGEPLQGKWTWNCQATYPVFSSWDVEGAYPARDSAGIPLGAPKLSYKGTLWGTPDGKGLTGNGKGSVTVKASGEGEAKGNWVGYIDGDAYPYVWTCPMTDQPKAATGSCVSDPLWQKCPSTPGRLTSSTNPIPVKYAEAMKKIAACYRQAINMASPILWDYMSKLPPSQEQALQAFLFPK